MATRTRRAHRPAATVLVVEEDYESRRLYREALIATGYNVIAVEDGVAALLYLDSHPAPDAMVLNLLLPRISGTVVYEDFRSRKTTHSTPVVILTAVEPPPFLDEYVTVLRKPLEAGMVVTAVAAALGETPPVANGGPFP